MITPIIKPALLLSKKSHPIPGKLLVTEYFFKVPLSHDKPEGTKITLFARSATHSRKPDVPIPISEANDTSRRPFFCYLEGGPGFENAEPQNHPVTNFIIGRGYQAFFLDYRGVGLSTPITAATLALQGDDKVQAEYLKHFRADNNVMDLEAVRLCLTKDYPNELKTWSILGQSFGGFVSLTYLSFFPKGLREVFLTGGLAPINVNAKAVYGATVNKVAQRNQAYYCKYPEDRNAVFELATYLKKSPAVLPGGGTLTAERLMSLGVLFGTHGGLETVHAIILRMTADKEQFGFLTRPTLDIFQQELTFDINPIYAILHEAIYNYAPGISSNWAAYRVMQNDVRFSWIHDPKQLSSPHKKYEQELYFAGEMVFPFHFDTYPELAKMKGAAEILAKSTEWKALYNVNNLEHNTVPVYAVSYIDDMYVDYDLARQTAYKIKGIKTYETNSMYHDAIRAKSQDVLQDLFKLRDDSID